VLKEVQRAHKHNTFTTSQFRATVIKTRKPGSKVKKSFSKMSMTTFRDTMKSAGLVNKPTIKKPEGMVLNARARLLAAKARLRWTNQFSESVIYIDEACGQRDGGRRCTIPQGAKRTIVTQPGQGEKVRYLVGIGDGWKSTLEFLAVRRPVLKDKAGKTVSRTLAAGTRRKMGGTAAEKKTNAKKNKPNEGETWTADRIISIMKKPRWLDALKNAGGVVLDAQHGFHKKVVEFLAEEGVNVIAHPANSPDMNLVEMVHGSIKNPNTEGVKQATNNHELVAAYKRNWSNYKLKTFAGIVKGFKTIFQYIVEKNGGPTRH
jgi:hypothetical protein